MKRPARQQDPDDTCAEGAVTVQLRRAVAFATVLITGSPGTAARVSAATPRLAQAGGPPVVESTFVEMRHVDLTTAPGVTLRIEALRGYMSGATPGTPIVLDDKNSFVLTIREARVGLTPRDLDALMNRYVFNYPGAPLRRLHFTIVRDQLRQTGTLHKVVDIPFEITTRMDVTPDGMLRLHPVSMKIFGVDGEGLMQALDITLEKMLDLRKARGVHARGNDLLLEPDSLLPPPRIRGQVHGAGVTPDRLVLIFDSPDDATDSLDVPAPADSAAANYMFFFSGTIQFGKLTMRSADLQLVDDDPKDVFDFDLDHYNDQLVAGIAKPQPDFGLVAIVPDHNDLTSTRP